MANDMWGWMYGFVEDSPGVGIGKYGPQGIQFQGSAAQRIATAKRLWEAKEGGMVVIHLHKGDSGLGPAASLQCVISGGQASSVEANPAYKAPSPDLTQLARIEYAGWILPFLQWTRANPTADQAAALAQSDSLLSAAADGEPVLWNSTGLITKLINMAHADYPGLVDAANWVTFRDAIAGLGDSQRPVVKTWALGL